MLRNNFNNMQSLERDSLQENRQTRRGKKSSKLISRLIRISETADDGRVKPDGYRSVPVEGQRSFQRWWKRGSERNSGVWVLRQGPVSACPKLEGLRLSTARVWRVNGKHCSNWVKGRNKVNEIFSLGLLFMLLWRFGPQLERCKQHTHVHIPVLPYRVVFGGNFCKIQPKMS